jgi:Flp pilus assembly protein TadD
MKRQRIAILTQAERFDQAVTEATALLKDVTQPGDVFDVRHLLSNVYSAARRFPEAEEQLELMLKMDPNDATACNDLGYIWADQGKKLKEAEELIRKALELDRKRRATTGPTVGVDAEGENAAYIDSLGWVLFRRGDFEGARRELERASAMPDGDDPVIWDHLGDVYHRLEMTERARTAWQHALGLYEQDGRRRADQRYRDLKQKLKLLEPD